MNDQKVHKQHISTQFNAELDAVKNHLLEMGGEVESQLKAATDCLIARDTGAAKLVIERDTAVNDMEVSIDEECARILARRQPAASDLRLVLAVVKITTDLERIGDEAAKISRQAIKLAESDSTSSSYVEVTRISKYVISMLRQSLDAFARLDVELAIEVVKSDQTVDKEYGSAMRSLVTFMMEDPRLIGSVLNEIWALRSLERVGDHASNIAEYVIYLVRGMDVRHVELDTMIAQVDDH
jgi:phosphate transport system protein